MSEEVAVYGMDRQIQVSEDQKRLVKSIVFPACSDDELKLYLFECERRGVHPLDRLIFPIKRNDKEGEKRVTFQCSVDYLRAEAADTGEYDGQDEPTYGPVSTDGYPESATVAVFKKGISRPTTGTARWKEYYPGEKMGFMWRKMPFHMLAKCAEVLALRKAFPKRLAGLYVAEEMQSVDADTKPPLKEPQKKAPAKAAEPAKPPAEAATTCMIAEVTSRQGENNGKPYTIYTLVDAEGTKYGTFSDTFADVANAAKATGTAVLITYTDGQYGRKVTTLELADVREPGAEG